MCEAATHMLQLPLLQLLLLLQCAQRAISQLTSQLCASSFALANSCKSAWSGCSHGSVKTMVSAAAGCLRKYAFCRQ